MLAVLALLCLPVLTLLAVLAVQCYAVLAVLAVATVLCCLLLCAVLWSAVLRSAVPACYVLACYVLAVVLCLSCYAWPWWDELGCHTASIERDPEPVWVASECRL